VRQVKSENKKADTTLHKHGFISGNNNRF
jgi:hypothetical protein